MGVTKIMSGQRSKFEIPVQYNEPQKKEMQRLVCELPIQQDGATHVEKRENAERIQEQRGTNQEQSTAELSGSNCKYYRCIVGKNGECSNGVRQTQQETKEIFFCNRYTLSIEESSRYFRIGENKLRELVAQNPTADFILMNGNRIQIKRKLFEQFIDEASVV